jgi:DNA-binding SARP family transcriptional activator
VEIRILGPLEVEVAGRPVRLGPQQRVLLAILVLARGRIVPRERLVHLLWGVDAGDAAGATLRSHVSHLRRALESGSPRSTAPGGIVGEGTGYALRIGSDRLDAARFERLAAEGRQAWSAGDALVAGDRLGAALALWRGPVLADLADRSFALAESARLNALRRAVQLNWFEARLVLGRHDELAGDLEALLADDPDDIAVRRLYAIALYRARQPARAALVCREGLERLHDRGLDSAPLETLQRDILRQAPSAEWQPPPHAVAGARAAEPLFQLPGDVSGFVGRAVEVNELAARLTTRGPTVAVCAVSGPAGVGKSALAIHVAHRLTPLFPDGQLYADLRGTDAERLGPLPVLDRFVRALGVHDDQALADLDSASARFRSELAGKRILIVLDNAADAGQIRPLLPGSSACAVLITSRAPIASIDGVAPTTLGVLSEDDAVALLAGVVGPARADADPPAVRLVAYRCGLLPLALRIAGARLLTRPTWTMAQLAARLADEHRRLASIHGKPGRPEGEAVPGSCCS